MISISGYSFEGPYATTGHLKDNAGLYVILTRGGSASSWTVLDVGETGQVKSRLETHERGPCWNRHNQGTLAAAVLYTPRWTDDQRRTLETKLRDSYAPVCGVR